MDCLHLARIRICFFHLNFFPPGFIRIKVFSRSEIYKEGCPPQVSEGGVVMDPLSR